MIHFVWYDDDGASKQKLNPGMHDLCYVTAERLGHTVSYAGAQKRSVSCSKQAAPLLSEVYRGVTRKDTRALHAHITCPLSAAIRHRTADKNITSPIRQLNRESVLAA